MSAEKCYVDAIRMLTGDDIENVWAHWFLAKPKMIAAGGFELRFARST